MLSFVVAEDEEDRWCSRRIDDLVVIV